MPQRPRLLRDAHRGAGQLTPRLLTVGHGRLREETLGDLLVGAGVRHLVDVRRYPGSRGNPAVARGVPATWLPGRGIGYSWEEDLGGRRRSPDPDTMADSWWRVEQFRAYAAWTREPEFRAALEHVLDQAGDVPTVVMCSESVWWRCHRRLIADVLVLDRGLEVGHLMHDGRVVTHPPAEGARHTAEGVVWDG